MKYKLGGILIILVVASLPSRPAWSEDNLKILKVAMSSDIRSTNPGVGRDANTDMVLHHIVEPLVTLREDLTLAPLVAESYAVSDDGLTYTFKIRAGLTFHNGQPVTSAEIKWSWQRYLDLKTGWKCRNWYVAAPAGGENQNDASRSIIRAIDTPDPDTVVFHLAAPSAIFLDRMADVQCITAVLHPDSVDAAGNWRYPVGTGPFKLKEWRHGDYVALEKFQDYVPRGGGRDGFAGNKVVYADILHFMVAPDPAAVKAALQAGDLDVYPQLLMNAMKEMKAVPNVRLVESPTLIWSVLLFQTRDRVMRDVRLRRAVAHALNREQLANFTTLGYSDVNASFVPVADARHTARHDNWLAFDQARARTLLKQAGYRGEVITLQTNRKFPNMYENALVTQAMLQNVGMNVRLEVLDWASQLSNYYAGDFQMMAFSYSALSNPVFRLDKLIGDKDMSGTHQWEDPEAKALLSRLVTTADPAKRQEAFDALFELMKQRVPLQGLYNAHNAVAIGKDIQGFKAWPMAKARFWGVWKSGWPGLGAAHLPEGR